MIFMDSLSENLRVSVLVAVTILAGFALSSFILRLLAKWVDRFEYFHGHTVFRHLRAPLHLLIPFLLINPVLAAFDTAPAEGSFLEGALRIIVVALVAWLAMRAVNLAVELFLTHFDITADDNLRARQVHTQVAVTRRIVLFVIVLVAAAAIFMMFEQLRSLGVSLLASAGVAGIIIGFAAQKTIGNLLAGVQIALTQPIRLDDVVIVEGEWGRIEEITLTYVVVRIWDLRRLVLPISYFIEKPFQNWTRVSADILGTVYLYVDYTMPLAPLREKMTQVLEDSRDLWDGKVNQIVVTDAKQDVMELRALISAKSSSRAWDLRCKLREALIGFIQENYPQALPRTRVELEKP